MPEHVHEWRVEDVTGPMCHFACECGATLHPVHALRRLNAIERLPDPLRLRVFAEHILEDPPFLIGEVSAILSELASALEKD